MADSTIVWFSGDWALFNGSVASGALLTVYDAGTLNLASIFTDNDLTVPAANPVTADASGLMPFAWIGVGNYKVRLTTSGGTLIDEQDNISGAFNSAPFLAGAFAKPDQDFTNRTANYTVLEADLGTIINGDCSGGAFDFTLISAVTATNGKGVTLRHVGTANTIGIVTVSSQTITSPTTGVTTTAFELTGYGESVTLVSDGSNWHVTSYVPPLMRPSTSMGVIRIADRVTSAPASSPGTRYIVQTGFSTFETHDIIEDNGQGGFIEITPPTDCGWVAYVQDEDLYYRFIGSEWVVEPVPATQAQMETGTDVKDWVTPGLQHRHPSAAKCWGYVTVSAGTPTLAANYNVTSIADTAQGQLTVTIATDFSSANYAIAVGANQGEFASVNTSAGVVDGTQATGSFNILNQESDGSNIDPTAWHFAAFGDHGP